MLLSWITCSCPDTRSPIRIPVTRSRALRPCPTAECLTWRTSPRHLWSGLRPPVTTYLEGESFAVYAGRPFMVTKVASTPWLRALVFAATVSGAAAAQTPATGDTIAEARRLRDGGDFRGAAALMRPYVDAHPDDPGSARFAALMSYWSKNAAA